MAKFKVGDVVRVCDPGLTGVYGRIATVLEDSCVPFIEWRDHEDGFRHEFLTGHYRTTVDCKGEDCLELINPAKETTTMKIENFSLVAPREPVNVPMKPVVGEHWLSNGSVLRIKSLRDTMDELDLSFCVDGDDYAWSMGKSDMTELIECLTVIRNAMDD